MHLFICYHLFISPNALDPENKHRPLLPLPGHVAPHNSQYERRVRGGLTFISMFPRGLKCCVRVTAKKVSTTRRSPSSTRKAPSALCRLQPVDLTHSNSNNRVRCIFQTRAFNTSSSRTTSAPCELCLSPPPCPSFPRSLGVCDAVLTVLISASRLCDT